MPSMRKSRQRVSYELLHAPQFGLFNPHQPPTWFSEGIDLDPVRWMDQAACTEIDPAIFYRNESIGTANYLRPICAQCPVRAQCLDYALKNEESGWWGGTSERERRAYKRATRRDR